MQTTPGTSYYKGRMITSSLANNRKRKKLQTVPNYKDAAKRFFKPYSQLVLNGEEGLTGTDIANILNVKLSHVLQKVRSSKTLEMLNHAKLKRAEISAHSANGSFYKDYAFETKAAELIIAKYDNPIGWMYIRYLQTCREALTVFVDEYEKLQTAYQAQGEKLKEADSKIEALTKTRIKKVGGGKMVKIVTKIVEERNLFGEVVHYKELDFGQIVSNFRC